MFTHAQNDRTAGSAFSALDMPMSRPNSLSRASSSSASALYADGTAATGADPAENTHW